MNINAVDLFCGIGGLTNGFQQAGINVVAGFDIEEDCKFAYEYNNKAKFILKDVKEITDTEINELYPKDTDIKVLIGCAPCQPFSNYSHRYKGSDVAKNKMDLLDYFGKQVKNVKPEIISMENVPQMAKEEVFNNFLKILKSEGYFIDWKVAYAPAYGVPQRRKRLLLLASKIGEIKIKPEIYDKENYPTLRQTISTLPKIQAGETFELDRIHTSRKLSPLNIKRIKSSKPGGTWKDWDSSLLPNAYKKKSGQTYGSVYGRLEWDKPATTMTTQFIGFGNGRFGHPEQNRALSLREGALLQTFPKNYQFVAENQRVFTTKLAVQIGNAVPPQLGKVIGDSVMDHLKKEL
ncbi:DNA cytosine methyltransferase [Pseudolactococcus yaeyamensis]